MEDEVCADNFALQSLSEAERTSVTRYFSKFPLRRDPSFKNEQQNIIRSEKLHQNLALANENQIEQINFASDIHAPLGIVTAVILVLLLGTFGREPSVSLIIKSCLLLNLPLIVILIILGVVNTVLELGIKQIISTQSSEN